MAEKKQPTENKKVETLYVSSEMAEDTAMDQKLREDLVQAADRVERELQNDPSIPSLDEDPEKKQELFNNIVWELKKKGLWEEETSKENPEENLSAEDRKALELGRKMLKNKKSARRHKITKGIAGAAIVTVGVFTLSMSSEANRVRMISIWNSWVGEELQVDIDNDLIREKDVTQKQGIYDDIKEKVGITPIKFSYIPENMVYDGYLVNEDSGMASIFYTYGDSIVSIYMYKQDNQSSSTQRFDGEIIKTIETFTDEVNVEIRQINDSAGNIQYNAGLTYENTYYSICGEMDENLFLKMVTEIYF